MNLKIYVVICIKYAFYFKKYKLLVFFCSTNNLLFNIYGLLSALSNDYLHDS